MYITLVHLFAGTSWKVQKLKVQLPTDRFRRGECCDRFKLVERNQEDKVSSSKVHEYFVRKSTFMFWITCVILKWYFSGVKPDVSAAELAERKRLEKENDERLRDEQTKMAGACGLGKTSESEDENPFFKIFSKKVSNSCICCCLLLYVHAWHLNILFSCLACNAVQERKAVRAEIQWHNSRWGLHEHSWARRAPSDHARGARKTAVRPAVAAFF